MALGIDMTLRLEVKRHLKREHLLKAGTLGYSE